MAELAKRMPVTAEQAAEYAEWYNKTPMGKDREKIVKGLDPNAEAEGGEDGEGKKQKKDKKKKK